jgi:hypothetical protein
MAKEFEMIYTLSAAVIIMLALSGFVVYFMKNKK